MGTIWGIVLGVIILSLVYVFFNYRRIKAMNEGTDEMVEMAAIIRSGANTFMKTEYKTIFIVVLIVALIFSLFVEKTSGLTLLLDNNKSQETPQESASSKNYWIHHGAIEG